MNINVEYYQNFCTPHSALPSPDGYGGWQQSSIPFSMSNTAIVVMHTWNTDNYAENVGWLRAAEWLRRADEILCRNFPQFLELARSKNIKIIHVASHEYYCRAFPAYERIAKEFPIKSVEQIGFENEHTAAIRRFISENAYCGTCNNAEIENIFESGLSFSPKAAPLDNEEIAVSSQQLFEICKKNEINHLIYTGFCINWCLFSSPCGMLDMSRHGLICSTIKELVTAVENKETAENEVAKELALWRISMEFGLVIPLSEFTAYLKNLTDSADVEPVQI
ncbi:MAG: hypothetical protein RR234_01750 [Christensenella sp.]